MNTNIELAREACDKDKVDAWHNGFWTLTQEELDRFAELVRADQRERDALICDAKHLTDGDNANDCAAAIRSGKD